MEYFFVFTGYGWVRYVVVLIFINQKPRPPSRLDQPSFATLLFARVSARAGQVVHLDCGVIYVVDEAMQSCLH